MLLHKIMNKKLVMGFFLMFFAIIIFLVAIERLTRKHDLLLNYSRCIVEYLVFVNETFAKENGYILGVTNIMETNIYTGKEFYLAIKNITNNNIYVDEFTLSSWENEGGCVKDGYGRPVMFELQPIKHYVNTSSNQCRIVIWSLGKSGKQKYVNNKACYTTEVFCIKK